MSKIVVRGGEVVGLSMALMLAKEGLDVTVLERDSGPVPRSPQEAWRGWDRSGVARFRQPHYLVPGGRRGHAGGDDHDADVFRAFMEAMTVLTLPQDVLARPGPADRITEIAGGRGAVMPPEPSRREVLEIAA